MSLSLHHFEAHRDRGAFDDPGRRVDVVGVEVGHLGLRDLGELRALDLARRDLAWLLRARLEAGRLLIRKLAGGVLVTNVKLRSA
jgi:hypothetical protein